MDLLHGPEGILHSSDDPLERRSAAAWPDPPPACLHWRLKMCEPNQTINFWMKEKVAGAWENKWKQSLNTKSQQQNTKKIKRNDVFTSIDQDFQAFLFSILCSQKQRGDIVVV